MIAWPWFWVLSPLWIPLALVLGVLAGLLIGILIYHACVGAHELFGTKAA